MDHFQVLLEWMEMALKAGKEGAARMVVKQFGRRFLLLLGEKGETWKVTGG